jgi:hypothetical protein
MQKCVGLIPAALNFEQNHMRDASTPRREASSWIVIPRRTHDDTNAFLEPTVNKRSYAPSCAGNTRIQLRLRLFWKRLENENV